MKTRILLVLTFILALSFTGCLRIGLINGDGNVVTKTFEIGDFDVLAVSGSDILIDYQQSDESAGLVVTVDQNILDIYTFEVVDGKLRIKPEKKYERFFKINPTKFTITTHSKSIKKFSLAGDSKLTVNSPLIGDELDINIAGSGEINIPVRVEMNEVETDIAGSGKVNIAEVATSSFDGDIAGSGVLILGGVSDKVKLSIAGSGKVNAFELQAKDLACSIAGSGDVEMSISNEIDVDIAGSGKIIYKGDPTSIKKKIAGSGTIKKAE